MVYCPPMRVKTTSVRGISQETVLSNTGPKRRGSPIPVILVLLILGAGGYFGWKAFESRRAAERARAAEYQKWLAERERLREHGSDIVFVSYTKEQSSSAIREKMKE